MKLRVTEITKQQGLTLQDLADKINVSRQSLANTLLKGNPTIETLSKIATALEVPIWQLLVSPEEVAQQTKSDTCPHCGQPIVVKTTIEKG